MNAKQFAWYYLINNGTANAKPSYYGGWKLIDKNPPYVPDTTKQWCGNEYNESAKAYIKTIGVDWDKTDSPESETHSRFTDTFHDPDEEEYLSGSLVLNNGVKIQYCAEPIEVTNVFEMMANMQEAIANAKELFGE